MPFYPLNVGDLLDGKYRIDSILGEGGMGIVFAATHVELHCPVALKVIRQELSQESELVARLMLEARAAAQIKSEHVCRVLDVGRLSSGAPYIVMEYLRGRNLAAQIRADGRLPQQLAVDYLLQACEAVAEAHRAGVIHRDLKPENLFLAEFPDGHRAIKVLDFGISKTTGVAVMAVGRKLTNPSAAMGSPHYMAPEQMASAHEVDTRADIWALGAILYEFLTGQLAFAGDSLPVVCAAVLQSTPVALRRHDVELPAELEQSIFECLTKDREQRPSSVAALAQKIAPFGTAKASESLVRIRRLLDDNDAHAPVHSSRPSTLHSSGERATPPTPIQRISPRRTPVETAAAVTAPTDAPKTPVIARRHSRMRLVAVVGGALLFLGLGLIALLRHAESTRRTPEVHWLTSAAPIPSGMASSPVEPRVQPHDELAVRAAATDIASSAAGTALPVSSAAPSMPLSAQKVRVAPATSVRPPKSPSKRDPYNPVNFGGRR